MSSYQDYLSNTEARLIAIGLSAPSKMPGGAYSLPAAECPTGSKLRSVKGSVCEGCYALRGNYRFNNVQSTLYRRLDAIDDPAWPDAMVALIKANGDTFFRWHDSGDLQSVQHLERIVQICNATPDVKHWLPTREYGIVRAFRAAGGVFPRNLAVRLSAHMIDGPAPNEGLPVSTVHTQADVYPDAHHCPAREQGNKCRECRACWDHSVPHVSYPKH